MKFVTIANCELLEKNSIADWRQDYWQLLEGGSIVNWKLLEKRNITDCIQYYLLCILQTTLLEEGSIAYCSAHTRLLTVMLTQTVGGREHSDLTDNTVLTPLRIVTNFIQTITLGILDQFQQSKWLPKSLKKTFQTVPKTSQRDQYSPSY